MVIDLYLLVLGHTKYKGIDLSTKYKVTVPSTKYFLHSYMYLVLGGKYKVQSTWPKVLGPSSITKVTVKYLVTQLQLLYLTQLWKLPTEHTFQAPGFQVLICKKKMFEMWNEMFWKVPFMNISKYLA